VLDAGDAGENFQGADGGEEFVLPAYVEEGRGDVVGFADGFEPEGVGDGAFLDGDAGFVGAGLEGFEGGAEAGGG